MIAHQDYELAEQLMNVDLSFQHTDKDENGEPLFNEVDDTESNEDEIPQF